MKKIGIIFLAAMFFASAYMPLYAEEVEQLEKIDKDIQRDKTLIERIFRKKEKPAVEEKLPEGVGAAVSGETVLVKKINVTGTSLLAQKDIDAIVVPFQNKNLTLRDMQKVADLVTDAYRQKGYVTSRAYLPPQRVKGGILEISVVEGITGCITFRGNKYFETSLLRRKINLNTGDPFDYDELRKGLTKINEQRDRYAKTVLAPGSEPGTTDIIIDVEDQLPIHLGLILDNFGSRYIDQERLRTTLVHNNLFGLDDVFTLQYQVAEGENYRLLMARYLLPIHEYLKVGFLAAQSKLKLGKEYEALNARGKSEYYSIFLIQHLFDRENIDANLNLGFDYKDVFNFQNNLEISRDRLRTAKLSLDFDLTDGLGRTIIVNEWSYGIHGIMGGLEEVDAKASRAGSGGKFFKDNLSILRLQRMPFNSTLLWKNEFQFTPYILTATEQFQIGGIVNVRGYPPAEVVGDKGYSMTWEWSMPVYLLPKDAKVPFSKAMWYDALRMILFYDWANANLRRPAAGEEESTTLRSAGCGFRFNLPEDFSCRMEFAWPLDRTPSDGDHMHMWFEVTKTF
ncbi:ShlB/FhaC/HecB family hemolysin secretion/activation protein [Candidatus Omnitrophota bacterium]